MKKVLIIAGVHGNEHSAQLLAIKLLNSKLKYNNIEVTILPMVNPTGALSDVRNYVNKSTSDLNRINIYDSENEVRSNIINAISECDLLIDLHNSPNCGNFCVCDNIYDYSTEIKLLYTCDVEFIHMDSKNYVNKSVAKSQGLLAMTYEFKGMVAEKGIEFDKAEQDILRILKAYDSNVEEISNHIPHKRHVQEIFSKHTGFIEARKPVNHIVEKGELIYTIYHDYTHFKYREDVLAPCRLKVIAYGNSFVEAGTTTLLYLEKPKEI